jgi:hypothetical protein
MKLEKLLKTALDELRMQMLGAQVLFGFQFHTCFQEGFRDFPLATRAADAAALCLIVVTLGFLIAAPAQHRLTERGCVTPRILAVTTRFAELALFPFSLTMGCDFFVVLSRYFGMQTALIGGIGATILALGAWYGSCQILRPRRKENIMRMKMDSTTSLHGKIDEMLTEARVILPGAQALLGFQFIVTLTKPFGQLPRAMQLVHFGALAAIALSIMLLIAPAAIHRMAFKGEDVERFHTIGSTIVTLALIPLIIGLTGDFYIATAIMLKNEAIALAGAGAILLLLISLWYVLPLFLRAKYRAE